MSRRLGGFSTRVVAAIEAYPGHYWRACCSHLPHAEFHDGPDMVWFVTDIPSAIFNQVIVARLPADDIHARIDETLAPFNARHVPMLWSVGPSARPIDLGSHLEAHGLASDRAMTGMAVDLQALREDIPTPSGFAIERVGNAGMLEKWSAVYSRAFQLPELVRRAFLELYLSVGFHDRMPFRHYVGLLRGEPVASSTLFLGPAVAGIWHVGTVPAARRQGIGAMMTLAPLRDARAMGHRMGVLYSTRMGANTYERLGFQEYCQLAQYEWSRATGN